MQELIQKTEEILEGEGRLEKKHWFSAYLPITG